MLSGLLERRAGRAALEDGSMEGAARVERQRDGSIMCRNCPPLMAIQRREGNIELMRTRLTLLANMTSARSVCWQTLARWISQPEELVEIRLGMPIEPWETFQSQT